MNATDELATLNSHAPPPRTDGPTDLIQLAVSQRMDADSIAKLVALVEGRERQVAEKAFTQAMQQAQQEMPTVVRDGTNSQTKSTYATLDAIQHTIKPVYARHGFALSFAEADAPLEGWKRTICDVRHVGGHSARYHVDLPLDGVGAKGNPIGAMNPVQAAVSTGSYGQRVLLCRIFNLTIAESDVDGQSMADLLRLNHEQRKQLDDFIAQEDVDVKALLKWVKADSLDTVTQRQFAKITSTYRQKIGGAA